MPENHQHGVDWVATGSALLLSCLIAYLSLLRLRARFQTSRGRTAPDSGLVLKVDGMTCQHCVASVKKALEGFDAVADASPDLSSGLVRVRGHHLDVSAWHRRWKKPDFKHQNRDAAHAPDPPHNDVDELAQIN